MKDDGKEQRFIPCSFPFELHIPVWVTAIREADLLYATAPYSRCTYILKRKTRGINSGFRAFR